MAWLWSAGQVNLGSHVGLGWARAEELPIERIEVNVSIGADVKQAADSVVVRGAAPGVAEASAVRGHLPATISQGAVLAQGWASVENGRAAGALAARIRTGEDPATIPPNAFGVRRPAFSWGVAEQLGVTFPPRLRERAEEIVG